MKELSADQTLFLFLNGHHSDFFDWLMPLASNFLVWIPIYLIVTFAFLRLLKFLNPSYFITNTTLFFISIGLLLLICVELLPAVFPHIVTRIKPCYDAALADSVRVLGDRSQNKYGVFTLKGCTVFAISTYLWFAFNGAMKWVKVFLIVWAVIVCYSRIYLGAHYPLDVLVSALSGIAIGYLTYRFYYYLKDSVFVI